MSSRFYRRMLVPAAAVAAIASFSSLALAAHAWGPYHWARTANPFTLKLGDNVSVAWDAYLLEASADWSVSSVLDTTVVAGSTTPKSCRPKAGRIEVCNAKYGNTGWLGIAQIWITGGEHITQSVAKMNDTYFSTAPYNAPAWRRLVMCQEIAHGFGLDHQDETFDNPNLGSCMDYTNDPDGGPGGASETDLSNEHPNAHDFEQLEAMYAHLDGITTIGQSVLSRPGLGLGLNEDFENASEWGRAIRLSSDGKPSLYVRDLGGGEKVFTFVIWAQ